MRKSASQEAIGEHRRSRSVSCRRDSLADRIGANIARGKNARDVGLHLFVDRDLAGGVQIDQSSNYCAVRTLSDGHEDPRERQGSLGSVLHIVQAQRFHQVAAFDREVGGQAVLGRQL